MKRWLAATLAALCLLSGCARDPGQTGQVVSQPKETGLRVRVAREETDFGVFTAAAPGGEEAAGGQALLTQTLELYPEGFLEQLEAVEVLLTGALTGTEDYSHGSYAGFTQRTEGGWLLVLDVTTCDAGTIHHEIAHILDGILTDAGVLTEERWMEYCPEGFVYSGDYAGRPEDWARVSDFFVDSYAMVSIREDRARLFETAVLQGEGAFSDSPALWLKLKCFADAIRSHFDTEGWPERTIWELALE